MMRKVVCFELRRAYPRVNLYMSRIKKGWTFADNRYSLVETDRVTGFEVLKERRNFLSINKK